MGDGDDGAGVVLQEALEPATDSASRWLVGSSSSSRSGRLSSSRHSATRRRSPPDSVVTSASPGGQRRASMAISTLRSRFQASAAAILSSSVGLLGADLLVVGVGVGPLRQAPRRSGRAVDCTGGDAVHHVALDVLGRVELRLLGEEADGEARGQPGLAGEAVVDAGHDPQQRRLAGAVGADHADLGAGVEGQRDVLQHLAVGRVEAAELVHGVDELVSHEGSEANDGPRPTDGRQHDRTVHAGAHRLRQEGARQPAKGVVGRPVTPGRQTNSAPACGWSACCSGVRSQFADVMNIVSRSATAEAAARGQRRRDAHEGVEAPSGV